MLLIAASIKRRRTTPRLPSKALLVILRHIMHISKLRIAAAAASLAIVVSCATPAALSTASIPAVATIDMDRYQGKWYEISRIPSIPIGRTWVNTSDNYSLNADGTVTVVYEGFEGSPGGARKSLKGRQWIPDKSVMGDTLISFFPLIKNKNRIILLHPDYRFLVVTSDSKDLLWIMSRTPRMEDADYEAVLEKLRGWGFEVSKLQKVRQEW
jgi:apolipoprotein D and lipocalin family protein